MWRAMNYQHDFFKLGVLWVVVDRFLKTTYYIFYQYQNAHNELIHRLIRDQNVYKNNIKYNRIIEYMGILGYIY